MKTAAEVARDAARLVLAPMDDTPKSMRVAFEAMADGCADAVMAALRSLPIEQRMEAMGMWQVAWFTGTSVEDTLAGDPFDLASDIDALNEYKAGDTISHWRAAEDGTDLVVTVRPMWVEADPRDDITLFDLQAEDADKGAYR